jgi:hypothetical protein
MTAKDGTALVIGGGTGFVAACGMVWLQAPTAKTMGTRAMVMDLERCCIMSLPDIRPE